jgi:SHS2 domain-containing protein
MVLEGIRFLEHPSDVGIEARGSTCAEAFSRAAAALISIILDPSGVGTTERRTVFLEASDAEQLLVRWLSEILYLYDGCGYVAKEFQIDDCTPTHLEAIILGEPLQRPKHTTRMDIKAVTYHQLAVWQDVEGWGVRVYLDI